MRAIATKPDTRTLANMAAGAPGEWKSKAVTPSIPEIRVREIDPRFEADLSKKPASTGPKPGTPQLSAEEVRRRQAKNFKASAGDVHGHNERQRAELPNRPLTAPSSYMSDGRKSKKRKRNALSMHNVQIRRGLFSRVQISA
ncbi:hypothetical protein [Streptomyces sp. NPDC001422]|uniref:hypothetical protein n=1 Tax=Streptomyces sp. NPDC001422 TaxID=3364575 RepID=UPI00367B1210